MSAADYFGVLAAIYLSRFIGEKTALILGLGCVFLQWAAIALRAAA